MKYLIFILFLLTSCKTNYIFKDSPCPTFEQKYKKEKKSHSYKKQIIVKDKPKEIINMNPKFR